MSDLLSLDLATRLGWAVGDLDGDPISGWHKLPKTGDELGPFAQAYDVFLRDLIALHRPKIIVFEASLASGGVATNLSTLLKLYGLCWHPELIAKYLKIDVRQVAVSSWKSSFVGTSKFGKKVKPYPPIVRCRELGWDVSDDNEADALGIWVHASKLLKPDSACRFDPLFRQTEVAA